MQTINRIQPSFVVLCLSAMIIIACNHKPESVSLSESETISSSEVQSAPGLDDATRFGYQRNMPTPKAGMDGMAGAQKTSLGYTLPDGWTEIAPTSMRKPNFAIPSAPDVQAYITVLSGSGGGTLSNYNRWRQQMVGMEPLADLSGLTKIKVLGQAVPLLDIEGSFTGMGSDPQEGYRLLALAVPEGGSTIFVKMIGPAAQVESQSGAFKEFLSTLEPTTGDAVDHSGHDHAKMPEDATHSGMPMDATHAQVPADSIHAGMSGTASDAVVLSGAKVDPATLKWEVPDGWTEDTGHRMRLASYNVGPNNEANCAVFVLRGAAGGVDSNVNRWRSQMGLEPLAAEELKALTRLEMLDREAIFTEISGPLNDSMSGVKLDNATMYALICSLGDQTMFIKMSGPREMMNKQKENFVSFCKSYRVE